MEKVYEANLSPGNFNGPNLETENTPRQIKKIIENYGIHVEADIWYIPSEGHFYLGHDEPKYNIEKATSNILVHIIKEIIK